MLGLDIDEPTNDPGAVVARVTSSLGGVEVFAYSTFSSMPAAFRLRAFVPYDRPATPVEHRMSWLLVARALAGGGVLVDKACKDPARGFFVWARPPSGAYWHGHVAGVAWPVGLAASVEEKRQAAAGTLGPRRTFPRSTSTAIGRARAYVAAVAPAVQGAHGSDATFVLAARLVHGFGLSESEALDALGPWNTTCAPPWSPRDLARKVREAAEKAHSFGRRPSGRATWKR
jgi:hypothetical protein